MPLGCKGGLHTTVEAVSETGTTSTISTNPGATEYDS